MTRKKVIGKHGEEVAVRFLKQNGYFILAQNYHSRWGEVDVVAEKDREICFIEVKYRTGKSFGNAVESITSKKIKKMYKTAICYLQKKEWEEKDFALHVIAIDNDGNKETINFITHVCME